MDKWTPLRTLVGDPDAVGAEIRSSLESASKIGSAFVLSVVADVPALVLQLIIAGLSCFFLLLDGPRFFNWISEKLPLDPTIRSKLAKVFKDTSISVIWATIAAALAQSVIMFFSFLILGIPAVVLAAGLSFIFAWVPLVGSSPIWIGGAIYLATQGTFIKMVILILLGLSMGIVDNIVRTIVLRGRGKMHPLVSLISILGGIQMFGIFGVFLGPILAAILISLLQVWPAVGKEYELL